MHLSKWADGRQAHYLANYLYLQYMAHPIVLPYIKFWNSFACLMSELMDGIRFPCSPGRWRQKLKLVPTSWEQTWEMGHRFCCVEYIVIFFRHFATLLGLTSWLEPPQREIFREREIDKDNKTQREREREIKSGYSTFLNPNSSLYISWHLACCYYSKLRINISVKFKRYQLPEVIDKLPLSIPC